MSGAMVSIPLNEIDDLRNKIRALTDENAALIEAKRVAEQSDPTGRVEVLVDVVLKSLPLVSFATANLDPMTIRGWPYEELEAFADVLETAPGLSYVARELALEYRNFAFETGRFEKARVTRSTPASCPLIEGCARSLGHQGDCADAEGTIITDS